MKPSIIIADDHPLLLKGLQDFLIEKKYEIIGSATNGKDAYNIILKQEPDIAILDIRMPFMTGIEIAKLCKNKVKTKIILITFERNGILYHKAKELNVFGYLLKEFALVEVENCLNHVLKGEPYFSPEIENYFSDQTNNLKIDLLTPSEIRVLKLISQNKSAREIASIFDISNRTVEKHKENIIRKLDLDSHRNSLLIWAKENRDFFL